MGNVRSRIGCAATGGSTGQAFYASDSYVQNWFRPRGTGGIHWDNYGGGWNMQDTTWLRVYGNKWILSYAGVRANTFRVENMSGQNDNLEIRRYADNIAFFGDAGLNGYVEDDGNVSQIDFTGQHRSFVKDIPHTKILAYEGLIVSADQNTYINLSDGVATGQKAITINESLPLVSLCIKECDKACFGVISASEDPDTRRDSIGKFTSVFGKEDGDTRVYINSLGEGAIWVSNKNGHLESGDYITTSNVPGYGMKQTSDSLKNHTVAKITMDCDFNPAIQRLRIIKKVLGNAKYWVKRQKFTVTDDAFNLLKDERKLIEETIRYYKKETDDETEISLEEYHKLTREEQNEYTGKNISTKYEINTDKRKSEPVGEDGFEIEYNEELMNVLDENREIQWEDDPSGETEKAYKLRFLLPDGTQIEEDEYTAMLLANDEVYVAAFVGCTYHCG